MITQGGIAALFGNGATQVTSLALLEIIRLFGHSVFLGLILSFLTYLTTYGSVTKQTIEKEGGLSKFRGQVILGSSNILFLCVGLTGVMILVSNNLARALAIGATMALMRFRVKLGNKNLGSNLLFGIIVGVACGLDETNVAYTVTVLYFLLQLGLYIILKRNNKIV